MKTLKYISLLVFAIILASCQDVVQVKLDEGSKLYVVDAFINDLRQDQVVMVTTSDNYFSNTAVPNVDNAQVILKDHTAGRTFQFTNAGDGRYVYPIGTDTIARNGHYYELDVTIDGVTYTASTIQKRTASIDSIVPILIERNGFSGTKGTYRCRLVAWDRADNNPDYYWIKTFRNDSSLFNANTINISVDGTNGEVYGLSVDSTKFTEPGVFLSFANFRKMNTCRVEIHSLSKDNYAWFVQAINQVNNGGLFATTPENVKTNFVTPPDAKYKVNGRFNMASVVSKEIVVQ